MDERADRLRKARIAAGFEMATEAADRFGWNRNTYSSNENGNATFSFKKAKEYARAFGVRPEWLYDASGRMLADAPEPMARIVGYVGADPEGVVLFTTGQQAFDEAPVPPGGSPESVVLEVRGHSMPGLADPGALIYFEDQRTPPTPDMLRQLVVVEVDTGEVLVKRLLRGSRDGLFDLESIAGPTRQDVRIMWAAHITAIVPPHQARRIVRRSAEAA